MAFSPSNPIRDDIRSTPAGEVEPHQKTPAKALGPDVTAQRRQFGGLNIGAAFFGWLVATGVGTILTALLGAAGSAVALTTHVGTKLGASAPALGVASGVLLVLDLALSYYAGGYVAGRLSRFNGARQGFGVWIIAIVGTVILGLAGSLLGQKFNVLGQLNLPHIPLSTETLTSAGVVTLVLLVAVTLLAAIGGGVVGIRYHHKVDRAGDRTRG